LNILHKYIRTQSIQAKWKRRYHCLLQYQSIQVELFQTIHMLKRTITLNCCAMIPCTMTVKFLKWYVNSSNLLISCLTPIVPIAALAKCGASESYCSKSMGGLAAFYVAIFAPLLASMCSWLIVIYKNFVLDGKEDALFYLLTAIHWWLIFCMFNILMCKTIEFSQFAIGLSEAHQFIHE